MRVTKSTPLETAHNTQPVSGVATVVAPQESEGKEIIASGKLYHIIIGKIKGKAETQGWGACFGRVSYDRTISAGTVLRTIMCSITLLED